MLIAERKQIMLPAKVNIGPDILFQELGSETVLLNLENEQYFELNEVGGRFWELLVEHGSTAEVLARMEQEYDASPESLKTDLAALIIKLTESGLIEAK